MYSNKSSMDRAKQAAVNALKRNLDPKQDRQVYLKAALGIVMDDEYVVDVPDRPGFVYARISGLYGAEVVQAYNNKIDSQYNLPVLLIKDEKTLYYRVFDLDSSSYINALPSGSNQSSLVAKHGINHSMGDGDFEGTDPVFVFSKQLLSPFGVTPDPDYYPSGAIAVFDGYYYWEGQIRYYTGTTIDVNPYRPTVENYKWITLWLNAASGTVDVFEGTEFSFGIGGGDPVPYIPEVDPALGVTISAVLLEPDPDFIEFSDMVDIRPFFGWTGSLTGTADQFSLTGSNGSIIFMTPTGGSYMTLPNFRLQRGNAVIGIEDTSQLYQFNNNATFGLVTEGNHSQGIAITSYGTLSPAMPTLRFEKRYGTQGSYTGVPSGMYLGRISFLGSSERLGFPGIYTGAIGGAEINAITMEPWSNTNFAQQTGTNAVAIEFVITPTGSINSARALLIDAILMSGTIGYIGPNRQFRSLSLEPTQFLVSGTTLYSTIGTGTTLIHAASGTVLLSLGNGYATGVDGGYSLKVLNISGTNQLVGYNMTAVFGTIGDMFDIASTGTAINAVITAYATGISTIRNIGQGSVSNGLASRFVGNVYRGTPGSPVANAALDGVSFGFGGHDGTTPSPGTAGFMTIRTAAAWVPGSWPTQISYHITRSGTTSDMEVMRIHEHGGVTNSTTFAYTDVLSTARDAFRVMRTGAARIEAYSRNGQPAIFQGVLNAGSTDGGSGLTTGMYVALQMGGRTPDGSLWVDNVASIRMVPASPWDTLDYNTNILFTTTPVSSSPRESMRLLYNGGFQLTDQNGIYSDIFGVSARGVQVFRTGYAEVSQYTNRVAIFRGFSRGGDGGIPVGAGNPADAINTTHGLSLTFGGFDGTNNRADAATIQLVPDAAWGPTSNPTKIGFWVTKTGTAASSIFEAMTLDNYGFLGLNVTKPLAPLHIQATQAEHIRLGGSSTSQNIFISFYPSGAVRQAYIQSQAVTPTNVRLNIFNEGFGDINIAKYISGTAPNETTAIFLYPAYNRTTAHHFAISDLGYAVLKGRGDIYIDYTGSAATAAHGLYYRAANGANTLGALYWSGPAGGHAFWDNNSGSIYIRTAQGNGANIEINRFASSMAIEGFIAFRPASNLAPGIGAIFYNIGQYDFFGPAITLTPTGTQPAGYYIRRPGGAIISEFTHLGNGNIMKIECHTGTLFQIGTTNAIQLSFYTANNYRMHIDVNGHVLPQGAGTQNFGNASQYWADISYKTLTDRGCLFDVSDGIELQDGSKVSNLVALRKLSKHPHGKKSVQGEIALDYSAFPKHAYKPAPIADEDIFEDLNGNGIPDVLEKRVKKLKYRKGEKMGDDGVEMSAVISMVLGALRELDKENDDLRKRIKKLEKQGE